MRARRPRGVGGAQNSRYYASAPEKIEANAHVRAGLRSSGAGAIAAIAGRRHSVLGRLAFPYDLRGRRFAVGRKEKKCNRQHSMPGRFLASAAHAADVAGASFAPAALSFPGRHHMEPRWSQRMGRTVSAQNMTYNACNLKGKRTSWMLL